MLFIILKRAVAFALGWLLAFLLVQNLPVQTMYPSDQNLGQIYKDSKGVCYMYQKDAATCAHVKESAVASTQQNVGLQPPPDVRDVE